jgi:hypothetical protein
MKKELFILVLVLTSASSFGQAVGTPYIFGEIKAPYVYQNVVTTFDGSTLSGWTDGYGNVPNQIIDNTVGNPAPSFKNNNTNNNSMVRDFGRAFKNTTIEFDIFMQAEAKAGFVIGAPSNGVNGHGLTMITGTTTSNGLLTSDNWFYTNNAGDTFTFNANQWYSIKIVTEDGSASSTKWYVNGTLVGNNGGYLLGVGTYFSFTCQYGRSNIDNIKITY